MCDHIITAKKPLLAALKEDPTDEDALCRLIVLLVEQQWRQEAHHLYQYAEDVLREEQSEPAVYTRELARRIRQGLVLRERGDPDTAAGVQTPSLVKRNAVSRDRGNSLGVKGAWVIIAAAGCAILLPVLPAVPPIPQTGSAPRWLSQTSLPR